MRQYSFPYAIYIFTISFLLMPFFVFSQNSKIDSLKTILPKSQDSTKLAVLLEICWQYRNVQSDTAILYGERAIKTMFRKYFS